MTEIKLELLDANQANEVRLLLQRELPQARIVDGTQDLLGGGYNSDKTVTVDYDEQMIDNTLRQHFEPQNKDWRSFQVA
ncbi:MAG TPA: hypothetical protein VJM46_02880 [Candidatus Saccharimonadales bacterium]|nr:hypothetical protein [Candidatus Saccharimonadales bacterium]